MSNKRQIIAIGARLCLIIAKICRIDAKISEILPKLLQIFKVQRSDFNAVEQLLGLHKYYFTALHTCWVIEVQVSVVIIQNCILLNDLFLWIGNTSLVACCQFWSFPRFFRRSISSIIKWKIHRISTATNVSFMGILTGLIRRVAKLLMATIARFCTQCAILHFILSFEIGDVCGLINGQHPQHLQKCRFASILWSAQCHTHPYLWSTIGYSTKKTFVNFCIFL